MLVLAVLLLMKVVEASVDKSSANIAFILRIITYLYSHVLVICHHSLKSDAYAFDDG